MFSGVFVIDKFLLFEAPTKNYCRIIITITVSIFLNSYPLQTLKIWR